MARKRRNQFRRGFRRGNRAEAPAESHWTKLQTLIGAMIALVGAMAGAAIGYYVEASQRAEEKELKQLAIQLSIGAELLKNSEAIAEKQFAQLADGGASKANLAVTTAYAAQANQISLLPPEQTVCIMVVYEFSSINETGFTAKQAKGEFAKHFKLQLDLLNTINACVIEVTKDTSVHDYVCDKLEAHKNTIEGYRGRTNVEANKTIFETLLSSPGLKGCPDYMPVDSSAQAGQKNS